MNINQKGGSMSKSYIMENIHIVLTLMAFLFIAIFGPVVGTRVTEKRMIREHKQIITRLVEAQDIERARLKKINEAHMEVIENYKQKGD